MANDKVLAHLFDFHAESVLREFSTHWYIRRGREPEAVVFGDPDDPDTWTPSMYTVYEAHRKLTHLGTVRVPAAMFDVDQPEDTGEGRG